MKYTFALLLSLLMGFTYAQDSTALKVETPKIITKLGLGAKMEVGDYDIRFVEVMNDSRCPKNVNCVRAGEAKVLFEVFKNDEFVKKQLIEITPSSYSHDNSPILLLTEDTEIRVFNLKPYPIYGKPIKKEDYYLQIIVEN